MWLQMFFLLFHYMDLWMFLTETVMTNLQKLLVEQELAELCTVSSDQFAECGNLSSQVALSLVLFLEEFSGEVVDKLFR